MKKLLASVIALLALAISPALGQVGGGVTSPGGATGLPLSGGTLTGDLALPATGTLSWTGRGGLQRASDGLTVLTNSGGTPVSGVVFGGATASFNGLRTSTNGSFEFMNGDFTGYYAITAGAGTFVNAVYAANNTAIPAGGTQDAGYLFSTTAHFGTIFGSGAPTASMARGSLYLRSDGLPYYNTNGTTGWDQLAGLAAANVFTSTMGSAAHTITSPSATALTVGLAGATNPAFTVDSSTALQVAGLKVTGAVTGGTVAIAATDSGAAANITIDAKGSGTIGIGGTSTGAITLTRATTMSNALTYGGVTLSNAVTGTGNMVLSAGPTFTGTLTASVGNFSSTLASAAHTITSAGAQALAVGLNGATNPAFTVDASTGSQVAGLSVKGAVTGGTVAVAVLDSGAAANLTIDAKGSGTIGIGGTSTGAITLTRATTLSNALTYGGVTLNNAVTGTGNMVLSAGPTFTGTASMNSVSFQVTTFNQGGTTNYLGTTTSAADTMVATPSPALLAYTTGACYFARSGFTNATTTPTINISTLGAKTIVKRAATALAAGDYVANMHMLLCYDGTNMELLNPVVN